MAVDASQGYHEPCLATGGQVLHAKAEVIVFRPERPPTGKTSGVVNYGGVTFKVIVMVKNPSTITVWRLFYHKFVGFYDAWTVAEAIIRYKVSFRHSTVPGEVKVLLKISRRPYGVLFGQ